MPEVPLRVCRLEYSVAVVDPAFSKALSPELYEILYPVQDLHKNKGRRKYLLSKLHLALDSTANLGSGDCIFVLSKASACFEMGPPLRRKEGSDHYRSLSL
jgi:hypothetical protein